MRAGRRILIVRLGAVGDVVRTLPLLHALRRAQRDAFIGWLVEEASAPLLREMEALDVVHVLERRSLSAALARPHRLPAAARSLHGLVTALRGERYDIALEVHGTLKAALAARLARTRVEGFGPGGSKESAHLLHDVSHPFPALPMTRVERALFLGASAGMLGDDPRLQGEGVDFGLRFDASRVSRATAFAQGRRPLVLLFPFASASGRRKRWPLERHVELGTRLAAEGSRVVMAWGSRREREEAEAALLGARGVELAPATDLVELTELLRECDVLVTGDTGPMHLAAAVGTPVVALFGPSDPLVNHPWEDAENRRHAVIVRRPLSGLPVEEVIPHVRIRLGGGARVAQDSP
jgi:lipopolysaccharide heptosyltransferase I